MEECIERFPNTERCLMDDFLKEVSRTKHKIGMQELSQRDMLLLAAQSLVTSYTYEEAGYQ